MDTTIAWERSGTEWSIKNGILYATNSQGNWEPQGLKFIRQDGERFLFIDKNDDEWTLKVIQHQSGASWIHGDDEIIIEKLTRR